MSKLRRKPLAFLGILIILAAPTMAYAAATPSTISSSINVTPAELTFNLDNTSDSQTVPVTITNGYDAPVSISAEFKGIDETAALLIPVDTLDPTFASALSISQTDVTIPAHTSQVLNVQVTNLGALSAGGHYATLVLTQQDLQGHALSIQGAVSITIFVVKNPGAYQSINLTGVNTNHWLFRLPTTAALSFVNNGNVLAVPRATVLVFNHSGHTALQKGVANTASFPLLPGKELQSSVKLPSIAHTWLPQKVQIEIAYRADGASQLNTATASFWYIPPVYLLLLSPLGWLLWRQIDKRRPHRSPQAMAMPITRVPPLEILRKLPEATKRAFVAEPTPNTLIRRGKGAKAPKRLQSLQTKVKNRLSAPKSRKQTAETTRPTKRRKP